MEIAEKEDLSGLLSLLHHQFGVVVYRVQFRARPNPLPVQILADQGAAVVANDDSVWIKHWYNF